MEVNLHEVGKKMTPGAKDVNVFLSFSSWGGVERSNLKLHAVSDVVNGLILIESSYALHRTLSHTHAHTRPPCVA